MFQQDVSVISELFDFVNYNVFLAETWFSILFTVMVEIVPAEVRSATIAIFLFLMNNTGGNLPLLVDPVNQATELRYPRHYIS